MHLLITFCPVLACTNSLPNDNYYLPNVDQYKQPQILKFCITFTVVINNMPGTVCFNVFNVRQQLGYIDDRSVTV